jgi:hypothetical protein
MLVNAFMCEIQLVVALGAPQIGGWELVQHLSPKHPRASGIDSYVTGMFLFDAARNGEIRLLAQCTVCSQWFVRKRKDRRFCSGRCRIKAYHSTDEGKAKRTESMRKYRAGLKARDLANLKRVKARK